jgi:hypothetical protein
MAIARVSRVVLGRKRVRSGPARDNGLALQVSSSYNYYDRDTFPAQLGLDVFNLAEQGSNGSRTGSR